MATTHTVRPRNAEATRTAILASARHAFARAGYDGAGLRDIAAGAGVTAMMVQRYFGSKERLFAAVVAGVMAAPIILTAEHLASPAALGDALATGLVNQTQAGATPLDGFLIMLHSASSPPAAAIGRAQLEQHYHKALTAALRGGLAAQRAAVILALVAGVQVMRQMIGLASLAEARPATLISILAPLFQQLVDGERPRRNRTPKGKRR